MLGEKKGKENFDNHTDFAIVITAHLEGSVVSADKLHFFDNHTRKWCRTKESKMVDIVRTAVRDIYGFRTYWVKHDKIESEIVDVPRPLKKHSWLTDVRMETLPMLTGEPHEYDKHRHLLQFKDGIVYDFLTGRTMPGQPWMGITKTLPHAYCEWNYKLAGKYNTTVKAIIDNFKKAEFLLQPHPGVVGFGHPQLCTDLRECILCNEFMTVLYDICKQDLNDFVYIMQHMSRMMSSFERLCEGLYFHGPSQTGKDVLCQCIESFFGDDFVGGLPKSFFIRPPGALVKARGSEECNPFEAALEGKKAIIIPDMPKGDFDIDAFKPLCEQCGSKTTSRGCGSNPTRSNPSYEITMFSNYAPHVPVAKKESGGKRRLNVYYMRNRFKGAPAEDEQISKPTLKERAKQGEFFADFFHASKAWYDALSCYDVNIWAPPYVREATDEAWQDDECVQDDNLVQDIDPRSQWVIDTFKACSVADALTSREVKAKYRAKFGCALKDAATQLRELGVSLDVSDGTKRFCKYSFDGLKEPMCLR